eukprot:TRINITY_DN17131_c0_g1_i1.p2 TRINITY_DN17131_c0_g1~~TRINITY_DN17131_c0_g1_i1.p2  ORF type:complete len:61 (-),score=6.53 TRINITY_DN17131_c0_g1_i1:24-206(-)
MYSITIHGGAKHTPNTCSTFGCRNFCMINASFINSDNVSLSFTLCAGNRLTATSVPPHRP